MLAQCDVASTSLQIAREAGVRSLQLLQSFAAVWVAALRVLLPPAVPEETVR